MPKFLAAAIQMNSQPDLEQNIEKAEELVEQSAEKGACFVALPENFAFLGNDTEKHRQAERISEAVLTDIPKWAQSYGVYLLAGGFPVRAKTEKVYNRAIMVNPKGDLIAQYDKIHLFDISLSDEEHYRESDWVEPGPKEAEQMASMVCDIEPDNGTLVRIGLSICYDVRFPELYRHLSNLATQVLCVPAAFTQPTGEAHWEILLRARAIENSCYVIAPAQTGRHGEKRKTYGHSLIIDPWGKILSDAGTFPGVALAEIDPKYLNEVRENLPSLRHRVL